MQWIAPSTSLEKRLWDAADQFDFVLANPPFNVNAVDKERLKDMVAVGPNMFTP